MNVTHITIIETEEMEYYQCLKSTSFCSLLVIVPSLLSKCCHSPDVFKWNLTMCIFFLASVCSGSFSSVVFVRLTCATCNSSLFTFIAVCTTIYFPILLDIWIVSRFWLLYYAIIILGIFLNAHVYTFLLGKYLGM